MSYDHDLGPDRYEDLADLMAGQSEQDADLTRVAGLIEEELVGHPDVERVSRYLTAGAGLYVRPVGADLEVSLQWEDEETAAVRAAMRGLDAPGPLSEHERDEPLILGRAPRNVVRAVNQG